MTTKEAIKHYETRAKKLHILSMDKDDPRIKEVYEKHSLRCQKIAEKMRQILGKKYRTATRDFS